MVTCRNAHMIRRRNTHYHCDTLCHYIYHYAYHYIYAKMVIVIEFSSKMAIFDTIAMVMIVAITIMPNTDRETPHRVEAADKAQRTEQSFFNFNDL